MASDNNPGNQIIVLLLLAVVLVVIIVGAFLWQLIAPTFQSVANTGNDALREVVQSSNDQNLINAHSSSFQAGADSLNNLEWASYTLFILMLLTFIIMCFYVRTYPFLMFVWIIIVTILFIISLYFTSVYQDMAVPGSDYTSWENMDFMLKNLPVIIFVVGLVSGIIMYFVATKDKEIDAGGLLPL